MKAFKNNAGFTLVELLVVITIIGILSVGGLSLFTSAQQKARDSVRQTDVRSLIVSIEQINLDGAGGGDDCEAGFPEDSTYENLAAKILDGGYLDKLPKDPTSAGNFWYRYASTGDCAAYEVSVRFEHPANIKKMKSDQDMGDDDGRYEKGTPGCINYVAGEGKCTASATDPDGIDTSGDGPEHEDDISYEES